MSDRNLKVTRILTSPDRDAAVSALLGRVERLEAALREIAVGRTSDDDVAGGTLSDTLTAAKLCTVARAVLAEPEGGTT